MKNLLLFFALATLDVFAQGLKVGFDTSSGGVKSISIEGDSCGMEWLMRTDGSQYSWVRNQHSWGLGYFDRVINGVDRSYNWGADCLKSVSADGVRAVYETGGVRITVTREWHGGALTESYTFTNMERWGLCYLSDLGIYTPLNDNYPNSGECIPRRCNVHIWDGGSEAYVCALRMGGFAPHLGLVLQEGEIDGYEIWDRALNFGSSHHRGTMALCPPDKTLAPGESYTLRWTMFAHDGLSDFYAKMDEMGAVCVSADRYSVERGDKVEVSVCNLPKGADLRLSVNGAVMDESRYQRTVKSDGTMVLRVKMVECGDQRLGIEWSDGGVRKRTHADILVVEDVNALIARRTEFILRNQQMRDRGDLRYGAFMVYDNEGDSIYPNNTANCNPVDRDEGAERIGMGVLLAQQYMRGRDSGLGKAVRDSVRTALTDYAKFLRDKLQTQDYKTFSSVDQRNRNRAYNYMWTAEYYFMMYQITGEKQYAAHGYGTLKSMYNQFGHGFYAIGIPVETSVEVMKKAGMNAELADLMGDYRKMAEVFMRNGVNYPMSEVNYEQSIVAPSLQFLLQMYLVTGEKRYLESSESQLPVLEAFCGLQPSHRLHEIAIRHWDGYWFGKRELFGDTFPHYWSTLNGDVYSLYAKCVEGVSPELAKTYRRKAEHAVRGNLSLFDENGRGYCAYLYPKRVNGVEGRFNDPYANDQDWALVYYLKVEGR